MTGLHVIMAKCIATDNTILQAYINGTYIMWIEICLSQ